MVLMKVVYRACLNEDPDLGETQEIFAEEHIQIPTVDETDVLVQVKACGISFHSEKLQRDLKADPKIRLGLGQDVAGVVVKVGSAVTTLVPGDEVAGIIPVDSSQSGCSEYVLLQEFDLVKKPVSVSFVDAAASIGDGLRVYTALHYLGHLCSGDTVLVVNGASSTGGLAIQLAHHWAAKVICTASSEDEYLYLAGLDPQPVLIVNLQKPHDLFELCMEETGGLGVDLVMNTEGDVGNDVTKHQVLSLLSVGGRWITADSQLQIDPPDSSTLFLKSASISFMCAETWSLSSAQQGRYLHILRDVLQKVASGILRPNIHHTLPFDSLAEVRPSLCQVRVGKVVVTVKAD